MTWTHAICLACWHKQNPTLTPCALVSPSVEMCCECGGQTTDGVYVRRNPDDVKFLQLVIPGTEDL